MNNLNRDSEPAGEQMTLFSQAGSLSHANHIHSQVNDSEKKMNATCGRKCLELYKKLNRRGLWAKMFSGLLIGRTDWYSTRCRLTWKLKGTKYKRMYFQLAPQTHRTDVTEFGLLQSLLKTPCAADAYADNLSKKEQKMGNSGTLAQEIATGFVYRRGLLPTPTVNDMRNATPPPVTSEPERQHSKANFERGQRDWHDFPTQPPVCSRDDGFSAKLDGIAFSKWRNESIKAAGNAIVPQIAYRIFETINQYNQQTP